MRKLAGIDGELYLGAEWSAWRSLCLNAFRRSAIFSVEPYSTTQLFHWLLNLWRVSLLRRFELGHWAGASCIDEAVVIFNGRRLLRRRMPKATVSWRTRRHRTSLSAS